MQKLQSPHINQQTFRLHSPQIRKVQQLQISRTTGSTKRNMHLASNKHILDIRDNFTQRHALCTGDGESIRQQQRHLIPHTQALAILLLQNEP
eukprot:261725-Chlamydomonas_euryale.AAC.1